MSFAHFVFFAFRQMGPAGLGLWLLAGCGPTPSPDAPTAGDVTRDTMTVHPLEDVVFDRPWPFPARDTIVLPIHLPERARVEVTILDDSGQVYLQPWQGVLPPGKHHIRLDLGTLDPGPWVCTVSGRLQRTNRAFVRAQVVVFERDNE